jgi:hypothetical protein
MNKKRTGQKRNWIRFEAISFAATLENIIMFSKGLICDYYAQEKLD